MKNNNKKKIKIPKGSNILEGSRAVALTVANIEPDVVSAYPITPQTHIVEDLAKFKADGKASYEYVRAESEFAAASIVVGASATGVRTYSATSSQGLLLMTEVIFNMAGLRLPIVLTIANRGVSSPITIWNDHQDAMTVRDAGWLMFFAENHQEAVAQHLLAYKLAETLNIPAMVNIDGFILTHSYEPVIIPTKAQIKKYLPKYSPTKGSYLNPKEPMTMGSFARPAYYQEIRQSLQDDLSNSIDLIEKEYKKLQKTLGKDIATKDSSALIEYYGKKKAKTVIVAMGSVVGTIKEVVDENKEVAVLKLKVIRPFPYKQIIKNLKNAKKIIVIEKAISLGNVGPMASELKSALQGKTPAKIYSIIAGLGGRDITKKKINKIININSQDTNKAIFIS
ncbi:MAG: pyruvate ferredoxin oxidoreductase [Candidatus Pacebacteria bacterium]|nr:pyruvate ferredoxin oxidoreductase [Candidatus Paceibacterota bacterium]